MLGQARRQSVSARHSDAQRQLSNAVGHWSSLQSQHGFATGDGQNGWVQRLTFRAGVAPCAAPTIGRGEAPGSAGALVTGVAGATR